MPEPVRSWRLDVPCLPPAVNHLYGVAASGQRYIKADGRAQRDLFQVWANKMRFAPDLKRTYALRLTFTVSNWREDIDGRIKQAQDCIFGARFDHRLTLLSVRKIVKRGVERTQIRVREIPTR